MQAKMSHYKVWIRYEEEKELVKKLERLLIQSGFHIVNQCEHFFPVQGYTALWLLSESHFALHSFPEEEKIYLELTSCVEKPFEKMRRKIKEEFKIIEE